MADYDIPDELLYTNEDEWARREDGRVVVGITDYAQQQLGDVVYVELPEVGTRVEPGKPFGVVESHKADAELYPPVAGEVVARNEDLAERPELVNEDCYGNGWMIAIGGAPDDAVDALRSAESYRGYVDERSD